MKTLMLLMTQYDARAVIPVEIVCRDYFHHLTPDKFVRKCSSGEIRPCLASDYWAAAASIFARRTSWLSRFITSPICSLMRLTSSW